jgi:hypothetical protein
VSLPSEIVQFYLALQHHCVGRPNQQIIHYLKAKGEHVAETFGALMFLQSSNNQNNRSQIQFSSKEYVIRSCLDKKEGAQPLSLLRGASSSACRLGGLCPACRRRLPTDEIIVQVVMVSLKLPIFALPSVQRRSRCCWSRSSTIQQEEHELVRPPYTWPPLHLHWKSKN